MDNTITTKIGNATVHLIPPDISEEERKQNIRNIENTLGIIFSCKVRLYDVPKAKGA